MAANAMGSMHWTDEEAKLMKAIFTWEDTEAAKNRPPKPDTVGEFRILVIGAKGTGKTSVLTRVRSLVAMQDSGRVETRLTLS